MQLALKMLKLAGRDAKELQMIGKTDKAVDTTGIIPYEALDVCVLAVKALESAYGKPGDSLPGAVIEKLNKCR